MNGPHVEQRFGDQRLPAELETLMSAARSGYAGADGRCDVASAVRHIIATRCRDSGLALSHRLVTTAGSTIDAANDVTGARVTLNLPAG